jgi:hypothetical protein
MNQFVCFLKQNHSSFNKKNNFLLKNKKASIESQTEVENAKANVKIFESF